MSEKKYVLYIGAMVMPDKNAGAQRAMSLAKGIRDIGYNPVIIGLSYEKNVTENILDTKACYQGIDCFSIVYPKTVKQWLNRMSSIKDFDKIINYYGKDKIHSIIAIDYEIFALYRLQRYCKQNRIYLIADNMEWYEKSTLPFPQNCVKDFDTFWRMKKFYPKLKNKICISRYLYNHYVDLAPQFNTVLIPVTVDHTEDKWEKLPEYTPSTIIRVVYAGNPGDHCIKERLDWLIQAICEVNALGFKCQLKVIGVEKKIFEAQYPELTKHPQYKSIIYLGKRSHKECLEIISTSDLFTIVREDRLVTRAGFPTKLSEGLACGTPVLTTPSSNIVDYVEDSKNGFVTNTFTYDDVKETLLRAVKVSETKQIEMRRFCRENNKLDYRNFNMALSEFFDKLQM